MHNKQFRNRQFRFCDVAKITSTFRIINSREYYTVLNNVKHCEQLMDKKHRVNKRVTRL